MIVMTTRELMYLTAAVLAIIGFFIAIFEIRKLKSDNEAKKHKLFNTSGKLRSLMVGLDIQEIEVFLKTANMDSYFKLGNQYSSRSKELREELDDLKEKTVPVANYKYGPNELNLWFGLSRSSFLVLPRTFMQEMGPAWQAKMAALLHEYDMTFDDSTNGVYDSCTVRVKKKGKLVKTPEWLINYKHPDREKINCFRITPKIMD